MKLYELSNEIEKHLEAYNQVDNQEGLDAVEKQLDSLEMAFKDKALSVAHYIINKESDVEQIESEIARLTLKKASIESASNSLRGYLKRCMLETGVEDILSPTVNIAFRKSSRVDVIDESKIPEKYFDVKTTRTVMKRKIKKDWEETGIGVEGAKIVEEKNLQIK